MCSVTPRSSRSCASACSRHSESGPPDTATTTGAPGTIMRCAVMKSRTSVSREFTSLYSNDRNSLACGGAVPLLEPDHVECQPILGRIQSIQCGADGREIGPAEQIHALIIA